MQAGLAIKGNDLRLKATWLDFLLVVLHDIGNDGSYSLRRFNEHSHSSGLFGQISLILFGEVSGDIGKGFIDGFLIDMQLHQARLKVQRLGGIVADGLLKRVAAHIALLILYSPKSPESIAVPFVDRRACETKEEGIRQGLAHLVAKVTLLCAVSFIDHQDDVAARIEHARSLGELVNGGDDNLACILCQ